MFKKKVVYKVAKEETKRVIRYETKVVIAAAATYLAQRAFRAAAKKYPKLNVLRGKTKVTTYF